jgi:c-di-GMP-binding flagellar brake protein YcgR
MDKNYTGDERRQFKRFMFSATDDVFGLVQLPYDSEVAYKIADISAGGLRFIPQRDESVGIRSGTTLFLQRIQGQTQLTFLSGVKLTVRWVLDESQFAHVMIGCEFVDFPEHIRRRIEHFIDAQTAGGRWEI